MKFTFEQETAIAANVPTLLLKALAGTGKTSTLVGVAEARPRERMLYITYNASARDAAKGRFPSNVKVMTANGVAFRDFGHLYADADKLIPGLRPYEIHRNLKLDQDRNVPGRLGMLYALRIKETIERFIGSASSEVLLEHVSIDLGNAAEMNYFDPKQMLLTAQRGWDRMCNLKDAGMGMTHDGYLKLFLLAGANLGRYDRVMLDEAQDSNPVTLEIMKAQRMPRIFVGDTHQSIYQYRGAVDAMANIPADLVVPLSTSFRFGEELAKYANYLLVAKDSDLMVRGAGAPTEVSHYNKDEPLPRQFNGQVHHVSRGNAYVFEKAIDAIGADKRIGFVGGVEGYRFGLLEDVYRLKTGASPQDAFLRSFDSYDALKNYAQDVDDRDLLRCSNLCEKHGPLIPSYISRILSNSEKLPERAEVVFATAHKSKGLEFDTMVMADDFSTVIPKGLKAEDGKEPLAIKTVEQLHAAQLQKNDPRRRDETNVSYVAATRGKRRVFLPDQVTEIGKLLDIEEQILKRHLNAAAMLGQQAAGQEANAAPARRRKL